VNLADVTIYEMRMLIRDASDLLVVDIGKVKGPNGQAGFVDGAPVVPSSAICDLGVADDGVVKLSDDIDEITSVVLGWRMVAVLVVFVMPLLSTLLLFIASLARMPALACCAAVSMLLPGLLIFVVVGAHDGLALVTADACHVSDSPGAWVTLAQTLTSLSAPAGHGYPPQISRVRGRRVQQARNGALSPARKVPVRRTLDAFFFTANGR
jgi:hypothetical protein